MQNIYRFQNIKNMEHPNLNSSLKKKIQRKKRLLKFAAEFFGLMTTPTDVGTVGSTRRVFCVLTVLTAQYMLTVTIECITLMAEEGF